MLIEGETPAREVPDDPLAQARHVFDQRRIVARCQDIDRPARKALVQEADDGMAANEIADPLVGDQENRALRPVPTHRQIRYFDIQVHSFE